MRRKKTGWAFLTLPPPLKSLFHIVISLPFSLLLFSISPNPLSRSNFILSFSLFFSHFTFFLSFSIFLVSPLPSLYFLSIYLSNFFLCLYLFFSISLCETLHTHAHTHTHTSSSKGQCGEMFGNDCGTTMCILQPC